MPFDQQPVRSRLDVAAERFALSAEDQALFLLWFLVCVVCNFLFALFVSHIGPDTEVLIGAGMGFLFAQFAVHAIWSVMGPWIYWIRLLFSISTGLVLFGTFLGGVAIEEGDDSGFREITWAMLCCLPLYLLAIQAPLWAVRAWRNARFVHDDRADDPVETRPMSVRDLMLGTVIVAMAFAAARLGKPNGVKAAAEFLGPVMIAACAAAAFSAFTTVPTVYAVHRARNTALAIAVTVGVEAFVYLAAIAIISLLIGNAPGPSEYPLLTTVFIGFFVFLTGPVLAVRFAGYRLLWGRAARSERFGDVGTVGGDGGEEAANDGQDDQAGD